MLLKECIFISHVHIEGEMFPAVIISQLNLIRSHNNNNDKQLR